MAEEPSLRAHQHLYELLPTVALAEIEAPLRGDKRLTDLEWLRRAQGKRKGGLPGHRGQRRALVAPSGAARPVTDRASPRAEQRTAASKEVAILREAALKAARGNMADADALAKAKVAWGRYVAAKRGAL